MTVEFKTTQTPERLAYWYLRLNGFLLLENFIIHDDSSSNQRTDADLLGVRFRDRAELLHDPMPDDPRVAVCDTPANVVIAEVKTGECKLNGPWTREADRNIQRVLSAIGCVAQESVDDAAAKLYAKGAFRNDSTTIRLLAFGDRHADITPDVPQVLFDEMITFVFGRFSAYQRQKANLGNWPADGQQLHHLFSENRAEDDFRLRTRRLFRLQPDRHAETRNA